MDPIEVMKQMATARLLVIGDIILDRYIDGNVTRVSPEAPVPVLNVMSEAVFLGGAANVAINASRICSEVSLIYVEPQTGFGANEISEALGRYSVHRFPISHPRALSIKTRYRAAGQQLIRVDAEDVTNLGLEAQILHVTERLLATKKFDAVVISDYDKGFFTDDSLKDLIELANVFCVPTYVDPKRYNPATFDGVTVLKPNKSEALRFLAQGDDKQFEVSRKIREATAATFVVTTNASSGVEVAMSTGVFEIPAPDVLPADVSGAGDTFLAWLSVAHSSGVEIVDAIRIATSAASAACLQVGVKPPEMGDVFDLFIATYKDSSARIIPRCESELLTRVLRRPMVFTNGCFDVLHPGHISLLEFARAQGASLVVGLNSDESVERLKGPRRPLQDATIRSRVLAAMSCVSAVIEFDEDDPLALIRELRPDVLVKGGDYQGKKIAGQDFVEKNGGRIIISQSFGDHSTTRFIEQLK